MKKIGIVFAFCLLFWTIQARILPVGSGKEYARITDAATVAQPGDTILTHDAVINGGMSIRNLKGNQTAWITLMPADGVMTIIRGGGNSIQFSDAEYVRIEGFIIEQQTGNGMNIDDAGTYSTPTHHIHIRNCTFRNINATGNNDLLKLSGLEDFEITGCTFINGAAGGSGIDMVGCHRGIIAANRFENLGSNSIQAKGGTSSIDILRNVFKNGGARALNLGGSTGLEFFRPLNATTEAERINVTSNVIEGSEAAIAFVGSRQVSIINNTIIFPTKWIFRILQETVDLDRFLPCGENTVFNNLIIIDQRVSTECNIGPNTAPETFLFTNNLWFRTNSSTWSGPNLPGRNENQIISDPLIVTGSLYRIPITSPAVGKGLTFTEPYMDIEGRYFNAYPSLGAYEANPLVSVKNEVLPIGFSYNNPVVSGLSLYFFKETKRSISLISTAGMVHNRTISDEANVAIDMSLYPSGIYILQVVEGRQSHSRTIIKL